MGAWIETQTKNQDLQNEQSHPSWVRGLKHGTTTTKRTDKHVAPLVGAWIETLEYQPLEYQPLVAPLVGAWIETRNRLVR